MEESLESIAIGGYKYKVLNFIGFGVFNVWLVGGLVIEENNFG